MPKGQIAEQTALCKQEITFFIQLHPIASNCIQWIKTDRIESNKIESILLITLSLLLPLDSGFIEFGIQIDQRLIIQGRIEQKHVLHGMRILYMDNIAGIGIEL